MAVAKARPATRLVSICLSFGVSVLSFYQNCDGGDFRRPRQEGVTYLIRTRVPVACHRWCRWIVSGHGNEYHPHLSGESLLWLLELKGPPRSLSIHFPTIPGTPPRREKRWNHAKAGSNRPPHPRERYHSSMLQQTSDHSFYDSQENQPIACILYRTLGNFSRPAQVSTALFSVGGKRHPGFIKALTQRSVKEPPLLQDRHIRVVEEAGRDFFW